MIAAGYPQERIIDVYTSVGKTRLDAICENLDWHMDEDADMSRWTLAAKITVRVVFPCERRLFDQTFHGSITDEIIDARFVEIVEGCALRLMRFMEPVISSTKSPHNLFQILDLYEFLSDLLPEIRTIFGSRSGEGIINQAEKTLSTLSDFVRDTFSKLDQFVLLADKSRTPVPEGRIHPINRYVMNLILFLAEYKQTITKIIVSNPSPSTSTSTLATEFEIESASPVELQFLQIILSMKYNLEYRFKSYKNASLGHFFMMNNLHYMVAKINKSPSTMKKWIGDDFINKLTDEYKRASDMYRESAWESVLDSLRTDTGFLLSFMPKIVYRHRLKVFNDKFNEACKTQSSWVVPDDQLRKDLRASIVDMIVPVYASFLERHKSDIERVISREGITLGFASPTQWRPKSDIERGDHPGICITHAVETLRKAVDGIFVD